MLSNSGKRQISHLACGSTFSICLVQHDEAFANMTPMGVPVDLNDYYDAKVTAVSKGKLKIERRK